MNKRLTRIETVQDAYNAAESYDFILHIINNEKKKFIELTFPNGNKFIVNRDHIVSVWETSE